MQNQDSDQKKEEESSTFEKYFTAIILALCLGGLMYACSQMPDDYENDYCKTHSC